MYKFGMPVEDLMVVNTSQYIRAIVKLIEEDKNKMAKDIMKKHKKCGQRHRR